MARFFAVAMSQAPGLSGMPVLGPPLERRDERLLREVLGEADVADHAHEAADEPGGLDPPDRLDGRARGALAHRCPARSRVRTSSTSPGRSSCARSSASSARGAPA